MGDNSLFGSDSLRIQSDGKLMWEIKSRTCLFFYRLPHTRYEEPKENITNRRFGHCFHGDYDRRVSKYGGRLPRTIFSRPDK